MQPQLEFIRKNPIPALFKGPESFSSLEDFYQGVILPVLPEPEQVNKMHKVLMEYVSHPESILWIRDYSNVASRIERAGDDILDSSKFYCTLRRGWMTSYTDCSYAFCDNSFSTIFYALAYHNQTPTAQHLLDTMIQKMFPYGEARFIDRNFEVPKQAFSESTSIIKKGRKLSHIYGIKSEYTYATTEAEFELAFKSFYSRGRRDEYQPEGGVIRRVMNHPIPPEFKKRLIAQFIRLVHPLNHFLTPLKRFHSADVNLIGNDIGEDPRMLAFMKRKIAERYPADIIEEFKDMAMARDVEDNENETSIRLTVGLEIEKAGHPRAVRPTRTRTRSGRQEITLHGTKLPKELLEDFLYYREGGNLGERQPSVASVARRALHRLNSWGLLDGHVLNLVDANWCKHTFKLHYPLLITDVEPQDVSERFSVKGDGIIVIDGMTYYITNDWFPKQLQAFIDWCEALF